MSIVLDVRGLPPCEPMDRTLVALDELPPGETLEVLIHRDPLPLYDLLRSRGFVWQTEPYAADDGSAGYRLRIQEG